MQGDQILKGILLRLFAVACLATMSALIKLAEMRGAGLVETMFHRQLWAVPLVTAWVAAGPGLGSIRTRRFGAHAARTAVGLTGMVFTFGAVLLLPLAEAVTFQFTVPIFATILGAVLLKEPTGRHRWGAVIAGFAGGLLAALFVAIVAILLRQIGKTEATGTTVFWFSVLSVPVLAIPYAFAFKAHDPVTWAMLVGIGLIGGVGQLALTGSVKHAPVSAVVPMDYSSLIWGTLYGWAIFGMWPSAWTWLGAPVIIASGLYIVWRERRRGIPDPAVTSAEMEPV